ncbi:fimbrillin family protein [Parabacteroides sp.]
MKRLLLYMVCTGLFSGCSPDNGTFTPVSAAIRFASGISVEVSRAEGTVSGSTLPQASRISLFANNGEAVVMNNLAGTVGAEGAIDYNPVKYYETGKTYAFYACYPFDASLVYSDATQVPSVAIRLKTQAGEQDDYMWAALTGVEPESHAPVLKLTFRHALSRLRIRIWNGSGAEVGLSNITVKAPGNGTLLIADGSWSDIGETNAWGTNFSWDLSTNLGATRNVDGGELPAWYPMSERLDMTSMNEDKNYTYIWSASFGTKPYVFQFNSSTSSTMETSGAWGAAVRCVKE